MSSSQHFFFKRGELFKFNFIATYNIWSPKKDSNKNMVLYKKDDDITRFNGTYSTTRYPVPYIARGEV
jgi:hypothetical protein